MGCQVRPVGTGTVVLLLPANVLGEGRDEGTSILPSPAPSPAFWREREFVASSCAARAAFLAALMPWATGAIGMADATAPSALLRRFLANAEKNECLPLLS